MHNWEQHILFGTPVMKAGESYELSKIEQHFIRNIPYECNVGGGGNRRSVNSYILRQPELASLNNYLERQLRVYSHDFLKIKEQAEFYITQSWTNINPPGAFHHRHYHPNSLISCIYYVQGSSATNFYRRDKRGGFPLSFNYKEYNTYNSTSYYMAAVPGKSVFFPSDLEHGVADNDTTTDRISLSFNTFVKGDFGSEKALDALELGKIWNRR